MNLVEFPECNKTYAKDQAQYRPLPAHDFDSEDGRIACCWMLSWRERLVVLVTGKIWHQILTCSLPLQPQLLTVEKPMMNHTPRPPAGGRP